MTSTIALWSVDWLISVGSVDHTTSCITGRSSAPAIPSPSRSCRWTSASANS